MRKLVVYLSCTILLLAASSVAVLAQTSVKVSDSPTGVRMLSQDQQGITLKVDVGEVDFIDVATREGVFATPVVKGFGRSHNIGEPDLPTANRLLSIPYNCDLKVSVIGFDVEEIDLTALGVDKLLLPTQPSISKSEDPASVPFEFNQTVYSQSAFYSQELAQAEVLGVMRSLNIGRVTVSPMQYNPVENKLRVYTNITVQIEYIGADWYLTDQKHAAYYCPLFEPLYNKLFNYEPMTGQKDDLVQYPVKYVIVSDPMFEAQLQPFIQWKTEKGFMVVEAYTNDIGTSSAAIKSYLQDLYENATPEDPAPSFVLLVGDDQQIPAFSGSAGSHITDKKFVEYTGDNFPEVYIGRFSAQNTSQLQPQIDKTLEYEQYTMPDPTYLEEVTLISGVDGTYAITHGNGQINYGTNLYFNAAHGIYPNVWLYPASAGSGVAADIRQTVNDGVGFMNYTAHCGHTGHGDPSFTVSDINNLTNEHKYLLGIGNCCLANTFGSSYSTPCFGEAFVQAEAKGGIGYIGGTNSTYWYEDYYWGVGYGPVVGAGPTYEETGLGAYDGLFHDHGEPVNQHYVTNSAIFFAGNMAVTESGSSRIAYYWEIYCLMGDPSVMTYLGIPAVNSVSHAATILMTATEFEVLADPGSYVGLTMDGVLHGAGYIDASGSVTLQLDAFGVPGTAKLVVTGQNKQPYIVDVQVIAPNGPYVVYDSSDYNDATGNMDGRVDAGETIAMGLQVKNVGPDDAFNVEGYLSTTDTFVTVTDDYAAFGTVDGNDGTSYVADAYGFKVASSAPDQHKIRFDLSVTGTDRDTWEGSFNVTVHAPVLNLVSVTIQDYSGNNNGILDPGETADLLVTVANSGSAIAGLTTGLLTESDMYVTVDDDYGDFGDIPANGGTADNSVSVFTVTADPACPMGHLLTGTITLNCDLGYEVELTFEMIVGDREPIWVDDFSVDQGWTGLGGSAEWTIGPCTGGAGSDSYGGPDPSQDHTQAGDNQVLGNDLTPGSGGDYNANISGTQWVYSPLIDCSDYDGVELYFWRWLGVESSSYDHAYFEVFDGTTWHRLFENGATMDDQAWTEQFYDVSTYADENPSFQIRFGMGPTDGSMQYCGWNIDDVMLKGYNQATGTAVMDLQVSNIADTLHQNESAAHGFWIKNTGDGKLKVAFESDETWIVHSNMMIQVNPYDSIEFVVTLNTTGMACGDHSGMITYTTNDGTHPSGSIPVSLHIPSPAMSMSLADINASLSPEETVDIPMVIENAGPGRLNWSLSCTMFTGKDARPRAVVSEAGAVLGYHDADDKEGSEPEPYFAPLEKGAGGPDEYGYRWTDSDEPAGPGFNWIDISGIGTEVALGDDDSDGPFPIGFSFPFYEDFYDEIYIGSNGILTFGSGSNSRANQPIPTATIPNNLIAMWWDDLDPRHGGNIWYYFDADQQRFIVTFSEIRNYQYPSGTGSLTFQAVLYPDGKIFLQYSVMDPGEDNLENATVGIEDPTGTDGLQICYNQAYMRDSLAIMISAWRWLSVSPMFGAIEPFTADTVIVSLTTTDLEEGVYTGQIDLTSNDPLNPTGSVPVTMTIASYICGDVDGNQVGPNVQDLTYFVDYLFNDGPPPPQPAAANVDGMPGLNVSDLTRLVDYLFNDGDPLTCD